MMMMQEPQQQHQPRPTTTTTSIADQEEEEEFRRIWMGKLQQYWMDEVEEEKKDRTLRIDDLPHWMDEAYIHRCFAHTGEVLTIKVIRDNKKTECYGFIEFKSHAIAESFLHKFNGTPMPTAGTNFSLNWAFGSGGEQLLQEEEKDDCAADNLAISVVAAASSSSDIVTTEHVDHLAGYCFAVNSSCWKDMLIWWRIAQEKTDRTFQAVRAAHRVYMIGASFQYCEFVVLQDTFIKESLDELPQYVDFFDIAKELDSMDALNPILGELYNKDAGIRAKAAKLINTMAKKNQLCWERLDFTIRRRLIYSTYINENDPDVQSIALDAISSLVPNDKPGISAFGREGYEDLIKYVFEIDSVNRQRKALNLIARLVKEHNSDYNIVIELKYPSIMMRLATSVDTDLRKAALRCLIVLASVEEGDENLKQILVEWIADSIAPEDLVAGSDETNLLEELWSWL